MAATQTFTSFADLAASDLAKTLGCKAKAEKMEAETAFQAVLDKLGRKAAVVWAFLQDQEACKRYGPAGAILHDADSIGKATGYDESTVFGAVIALVRNGWAKFTPNGRYVRAA